jgi:ammonia channel protein AmtB
MIQYLKLRTLSLLCFGLASTMASYTLIKIFWPSIIGVMIIAWIVAPLFRSNSKINQILRLIYISLIVPFFGLILGGIFVATYKYLAGQISGFNQWYDYLGSQLLFGAVGILWVIPLSIIASIVVSINSNEKPTIG